MSVNPADGEEAVDVVEEQPQGEQVEQAPEPEGDDSEQNEQQPSDDGAAEATETVPAFADAKEETTETAPAWVKELRRRNRELEREARQSKAEIARLTAPAKPKLGPKPTHESCDYDADRLERELEAWVRQKAAIDAADAEEKAQQARQADEWNQTVQRYRDGSKALRVPDYQDAEDAVTASFDPIQINLLLGAAEKPEILVYALGKDEKRLADLAKIKDPVKFTAAVARMETTIVAKPKTPPAPARTIKGTAPATGASNTTDRLIKNADKTGDVSDLVDELRRKKK